MKRGNKKAISPVIATVLLIMMVVVIALIIFLWFKNISGEVITKEGSENIKLACGKVRLESSFSSNTLYIKNAGNIPISGMKVEVSGSSESGTKLVNGFEGLDSGSSDQYEFLDGDGADKLVLIPVLLGNSDEGQKNYVCKNDGQEVII